MTRSNRTELERLARLTDRAVQRLEKAEEGIQDQPISCAVGAS